MEFRTIIQPSKTVEVYSFKNIFFTMGSCFADELYAKLKTSGLQVMRSPFGIVFNPLAMSIQLNRILDLQLFSDKDVQFYEGYYFSLLHHGEGKSDSKEEWKIMHNHAMQKSHNFLKQTQTIILTFGSAHYYYHNNTATIVANCHKIPQKEFTKNMADLDEMIHYWTLLLEKLNQFNPGIQCLFTVSPVRYLKDGFIENSRSKARLLLLCEALAKKFPNVTYYPSYEILMDDLRDYRFVKRDMIHPNEIAVEYIWDHFTQQYFDKESQVLFSKIQKYNALISHKIIHSNPENVLKHEEQIHTMKMEIEKEFEGVSL